MQNECTFASASFSGIPRINVFCYVSSSDHLNRLTGLAANGETRQIHSRKPQVHMLPKMKLLVLRAQIMKNLRSKRSLEMKLTRQRV